MYDKGNTSAIAWASSSLYNDSFRGEQSEAEGLSECRATGTYLPFTPRIAQSAYKSDFMRNFVSNYFKNSFREMVSFFAKEEEISPEDLKEIIDEIEKGNE